MPLSKYLTDYDSKDNPYPGGFVIARHDAFAAKATQAKLRKFGQFAVNLFGYPYDRTRSPKITARIVADFLPFSAADKKALKRDREYIWFRIRMECYKSLGIRIDHDKRASSPPPTSPRPRR